MSTIAAFLLMGVVALSLSVSGAGAAEPVEEIWSRTFGGSQGDWAHSVEQTSDGGYIIAGYTQSFGAGFEDVWLVKTDSRGNELWDKPIGGESWDNGYSVQQTSDGGYIVAGFTRSYGAGWEDVWLVKTDSNGDEVWSRTFGGSEGDWAFSVEQTSDGGYIVAGFTRSYGAGAEDAWLIKTNAGGSVQWTRTFGGMSEDYAHSVQQTSDGGYIVAGRTRWPDTGDMDAWLIRTDSGGREEWSKTFGSVGYDFVNSVQQTTDGGYVVAGSTLFDEGDTDAWLIKTDSSGNEEWSQTYGGTGQEEGRAVQQTSDGGYIMVGHTTSYGAGDEDVWLVKTDASGNERWNRTYGGPAWERGYSVQETSDGAYVVAGPSASYGAGDVDMWLIKAGGARSGNSAVYQWIGVAATVTLVVLGAIVLLRRRSSPAQVRT
jgi:hypothetical protein